MGPLAQLPIFRGPWGTKYGIIKYGISLLYVLSNDYKVLWKDAPLMVVYSVSITAGTF